MIILKGRIVSIDKIENRATYVMEGVKKNEQHKYAKYPGGNGTYVIGGEYFGTEIQFKVFIYDIDKCITFDLRDEILFQNNKKRISKKLLNYVIEKNEGNKVRLYLDNGEYKINLKDLDLILK